MMEFNVINEDNDSPVICIIGDVHRGVGRDNEWMLNRQGDWFKNWLFPLLKERKVDVVIQTGDFFDHRRHITHKTMQRTRSDITQFIQDMNIPWIIIPGNHDIYHKEHITPNSVRELLGAVKNVHVLEEPCTVKIGNSDWDFIPWICAENKVAIYDFITQSTSQFCVGHFELGGFLYYPGMTSSGESCGFLSGYKKVFSGHYHTISSGANVQYVGTPYTLTLGDADDERGVWLVNADLADSDLEFVPGPGTWHFKRVFNANEWSQEKTQDLINLGSVVIQLIITEAVSDNAEFSIEKLESELVHSGVHDVRKRWADMISSGSDQESYQENIENLRAKSPLTILRDWVDGQIKEPDRRHEMHKVIDSLYAEASVEK